MSVNVDDVYINTTGAAEALPTEATESTSEPDVLPLP
jgi:hypothetical protein